ncbi:MAG: ATP-binding protein [Chloroflexota bacterium]|nr:ATP-binding protein [Chloroflexota bacterium]
MSLPSLIVVTGRPGAGKTTLARTLAHLMRCPALIRDELKEGFVLTSHDIPPTMNANLHVYDTFFQTIELLLHNGITLVAEAAFQHHLWQPKLEPLQAIAEIRIVVCSIDPALARARFIQRGQLDPERERYHGDWAVRAAKEGQELPINTYDPPHLPVPTLTIDTSEGYRPTLETIVMFAMQREEN